MRHVVIVNDYGFINGGAGKIAIFTAIGLAERGEDVSFFCAVGPICDELKNSKVNVVCTNQQDINHKSRWKVLTEGVNNKTATKTFKELIDSFGNEEVIVHIHSWIKAISSSPFRILRKRNNVKVVVTLHDYFTVCPNGGLYDYKHKHICHIKGDLKCLFCNCDKRNYAQKLFRFYRYRRQKRDMRLIRNFIYISELNKKVFLEKRDGKDNLFYVRNFVETAKEEERVMHPEKNDHFLYVGRISEEKGVDLFCEAVRKTKTKAFVIGDGPMLEELKEKYPEIEFTGWLSRTEMIPYIQKSKAFVFPSKWYEGSPLTVVEMMSFGLPCIVSDASSATENVRFREHIFGSLGELCCLLSKRLESPQFQNGFQKDDYLLNCSEVYEIMN